MDFPDDLKLSPVGTAPPLPSTPPVPPARTRSSRRLPQLPLPESRATFRPTESRTPPRPTESRTPSRPLESRTPSRPLESRTPSRPIESRTNSRPLESVAVSRPTIAKKPSIEMPVAAKRQPGRKNLGEGTKARSAIHNKQPHLSYDGNMCSSNNPTGEPASQLVRAKSRPSNIESDTKAKEGTPPTPPNDILRQTTVPCSNPKPVFGESVSRESISSCREKPSGSISTSKQSPTYALFRSKESPSQVLSKTNDSPPTRLSNPRENESGELTSPKECSMCSVSSRESSVSSQAKGVPGSRSSPTDDVSSCSVSVVHLESSSIASLTNGLSSPNSKQSTPFDLTNQVVNPPPTLSSIEASPQREISSVEVSPSNTLSSLSVQPHQGETSARSSPVRGHSSARSSPPCQVSCDSSPRMSVKCLAENCEQISSYVSQLVISDTKSNNVNHDAASDVKPSNVHQIVISDVNKCESTKAADNTPVNTTPKITSPTKPVLKKADAIDIAGIEEKKKMERGISHATGNEPLVLAARNVVQQDFQATIPGQTDQKDSPVGQPGFIETPLYTFTLPDLTNFPEDFRGFLEKDLIELSALISLENAGRLNWWADTGTCQRLWPLATTGDGNCLLHAASLGMWGFHDRLLTLRKALYTFLTSSEAVGAIYRRWRWQAAQQNLQSGLSLTEAEWTEEWNSVLRLASTEPRPAPALPKRRSRLSTVSLEGLDGMDYHQLMYESLEEVHVLVLAHVLRRPIIIVADTILKDAYGEALAPIPFGGIYLPLEVSPSECHKCPLLLTYDAGHFSALVGMQSAVNVRSPLPTVIPLTDSNHSVLPIQFCVDPGDELNWGQDETNPHVVSKLTLQHQDQIGLLKEFLEVLHVPLPACFLDPPPDPDPASPDSADPCAACAIEAEISSRSSDETNALASKSKTAKQIQSVAKQFGSIGKTVSKKLKKNLGTITKLARSGSFKGLRRDVRAVSQTTRLQSSKIVAGHQDYILTAVIHTNKCLPYHQEMVANYLEEAKIRFDKDKELKVLQAEERRRREEERLEQVALAEGPVQCINPDCQMMGSALTSYLCSYCYYHQMRHETDAVDAPHGVALPTEALYGSGKSKFYVNADESSYETLRNIPVAKHATLRNNDRSIYLANSTFYRDNTTFYRDSAPAATFYRDSAPHRESVPLVVPVSANDPDPPPIVAVDPPQPRNLSRKKWLSSNNNPVIVNGEVCCAPDGAEEVNGVEEARDIKGAAITVQLPHLIDGRPCQTAGCSFFGTSETNYFCSKCFKESQRCLLINQASQV